MARTISLHLAFAAGAITLAAPSGCHVATEPPPARYPNVAPGTQPSTQPAVVSLQGAQTPPMYSQLLPIDLPAAVHVALAGNLDIQQARQRVEAQRGRLQSVEGEAFPVFSPAVLFGAINGGGQSNPVGMILSVHHTVLEPYLLVQWVITPGKVINDVVAARKRLLAANYDNRATVRETLRLAATRYYELALAQANVAAVHQDIAEAVELVRITNSRLRNGVGLPADVAQARAELAAREQDLILALRAFYRNSVALAQILDLDPTVTLVPRPASLPQTTLVRSDIPTDALLLLAVEHRDDLQGVRALMAAAAADRKSAFWNGFSPTVQATGLVGAIGARADVNGTAHDYGLRGTESGAVSAGWSIGLSSFGNLRTARASEQSAYLDAKQRVEAVRSEVVDAQQESAAQSALIAKAREQLQYGQDALRLARANLQVGTMTTLDVLHAQTVLAQARLRFSQAVLRYNQAQVKLLAAIGILDERSLL